MSFHNIFTGSSASSCEFVLAQGQSLMTLEWQADRMLVRCPVGTRMRDGRPAGLVSCDWLTAGGDNILCKYKDFTCSYSNHIVNSHQV